ncbi:hypothetical protein Psi02_15230 [Planotetraspora silvatica]|uniref:Uncharacterized protein n=1 Tax=Planotetraspora silvatica TaxID=234614 RepID=A0A8J3UGE0_9ACTN|nr:hypothetical protein Psi02_15230 [Planotetraspora silvatica]
MSVCDHDSLISVIEAFCLDHLVNRRSGHRTPRLPLRLEYPATSRTNTEEVPSLVVRAVDIKHIAEAEMPREPFYLTREPSGTKVPQKSWIYEG